MRKILFSFLSVLCPLLISCDADDYISRDYPCFFIFNTQLHPTAKFTQALAEQIHFTKVNVTSDNGIYIVHTSDNYGDSENIRQNTDKENYAYANGIALGAGGTAGKLIIGQTTFYGWQSWDAMCPNCLTTNNSLHELSWTSISTQVKCTSCGRFYSLDTGAVVSGGQKGDSGLKRYGTTYSGTGSVLIVRN